MRVSAAPATVAEGNFRASVVLSAAAGELSLKSGFRVRWRALAQRARQTATLEIAAQRAVAEQLAPGFVPIGPTVQLRGIGEPVDVAFAAERFRVRRGHRLVLAVESPCAHGEGCRAWQLLPARYENMRCVRDQVPPTDLRMQFGSVPAVSDSAAP